jgi:hypothetical protein
MSLFMTGVDGHVYAAGSSTSMTSGTTWGAFGDIGTTPPKKPPHHPPEETSFAAGSQVAGVNRGSQRSDLFVVGPDGQVWTTHWAAIDGWAGVGPGKSWEVLGKSPVDSAAVSVFNTGTSDIVALTRRSSNTQNMDVIVTGTDGQIYRTAWDDAQKKWLNRDGGPGWDIGIGGARRKEKSFPKGFKIGAVSRVASGLTVLAIDEDGVVFVTEYQGL